MDRDEVEVYKLAKKERGQYPAILTEQTWSININDLLYGLCYTACSSKRARWLYQARLGSQSHCVIWFVLPARRASHITKFVIEHFNKPVIFKVVVACMYMLAFVFLVANYQWEARQHENVYVSFVSILMQTFPFFHNLAILLFSEIVIFMISW